MARPRSSPLTAVLAALAIVAAIAGCNSNSDAPTAPSAGEVTKTGAASAPPAKASAKGEVAKPITPVPAR
jgi:hypothetical protein